MRRDTQNVHTTSESLKHQKKIEDICFLRDHDVSRAKKDVRTKNGRTNEQKRQVKEIYFPDAIATVFCLSLRRGRVSKNLSSTMRQMSRIRRMRRVL